MKKIITLLMAVILMMGVCVGLVGCGEDENPDAGQTYYVAAADFFYSEDKGHNYGNGTKEYEVGEVGDGGVSSVAVEPKESRQVGLGAYFAAVYLYLLPICCWIHAIIKKRRNG